jgi:N utilization substance protein B
MTGDSKSGGPKSGGPKSGGAKRGGKAGGQSAKADKSRTGKSGAAKSGAAKSGTAKTGDAKTDLPKTGAPKTDLPKTELPRTGLEKFRADHSGTEKTPVDKIATENTIVEKSGRAANDSHDSGDARNDAPKIPPKGNGHAKGHGAPAADGPPIARKANKRGAARLAAVQALYQMDMTGAGLNEILAQFESHWLGREVEGEQYLPAEAAFFRDIVSGVVDVQRDLDPRIDAALEATWPLKRIEVILRSVLRAGAYELSRRADIPARVVVSEYVDVARAFVDKTETGMVNAVLDRLARNVRAAEFG